MKIKTLALAAPLLTALPAQADQLPADVLGHWCEVRKLTDAEVLYRRTAHCPRQRSFIVTADGWHDGEGARCTVIEAGRTVLSRCIVTGERILNHSSFRRRGTLLAVKFDEP